MSYQNYGHALRLKLRSQGACRVGGLLRAGLVSLALYFQGVTVLAVPVGLSFQIATSATFSGPGTDWNFSMAGQSWSGIYLWACGYDMYSSISTTVDLSPDRVYAGTVTAGSDVCVTRVNLFPPGCYDVYVEGKKVNWTPQWQQGYVYGYTQSPDPNDPRYNRKDFAFQIGISPNANALPLAAWSVKNAAGEVTSTAPEKGHYSMANDGVSTAMATLLNTTEPVTFSLVGNPLGGCTLVNNGAGAVFTAGTNEGTVEIVAQTADANPCRMTHFWFDLGGGCSGCPGGAEGSCNVVQNNSVNLRFDLGPSRQGLQNAFIEVESEVPAANLGSPQSLHCRFVRPDLLVLTNADGVLRQVRSLDRFVDITSNSPASYLLAFYGNSQVGGISVISGLYSFTNSPFEIVLVELVGGNPNHVRVSNGNDAAPADYYWETNGWTLVTGEGLRRDTLITARQGALVTKTRTLRGLGGGLDHQSAEVWQDFSYGSRRVEVTEGTGPSTRTDHYFYTPDGMLQQVIHREGAWDIYTYDSMARQVGHYRPFVNSGPTTNLALCRFTASSYDIGEVSGSGDDGSLEPYTPRRVIDYALGNEVGRSYTVVKSGERIEFECANPGAVWNDPGNRVTVTYSFNDALHYGKPQRIIYPDGTLQVFAYDAGIPVPSPGTGAVCDRVTVCTGAPDPLRSKVVDGTKAETWTDALQNRVLFRRTDLASQAVIEQEYSLYDERGRLMTSVYLDGTSSQQTFDCCRLESQTGSDGTRTSFGYDAIHRRTQTVQNGVTWSNSLNASGDVLGVVRYGADGSAVALQQAAYDDGGQLIRSTDGMGNSTSYSNYLTGTGQRLRTITYPDLSTRLEAYAVESSLLKVSGSAVLPMRYDYGVVSDGGIPRLCRKEIQLDANGGDTSEWAQSYTDMLGRIYKRVYASANGAPSHQSFYNPSGQCIRQVDPDGVTTLYQYNSWGDIAYAALDMNGNGVIDFGGSDRIIGTLADVVSNGTNGFAHRLSTYVWATNNSTASNLLTTALTSVDGLQSWKILWNNGVGVTNYSRIDYASALGQAQLTQIAPDGSSCIRLSEFGRLISEVSADASRSPMVSQIYAYDAQGRPNTMTDARNGTTTLYYDDADQIVGMLTPSPDGLQLGQRTTHVLDSMGRVIQAQLPDLTRVFYDFATNGLLLGTHGSRTYPVRYSYDVAGRLQTMTTWTNFAASAGAAVTTSRYDGYRGFLTNQTHADGRGTSYRYTAAGRLSARLGARGITTAYAYDNAGAVGAVSYSDTTPGLACGFDRLGRQTSVTNGTMVCAWTYNAAGKPLTGSFAGGPLNGLSLTNGYDPLLRRTRLSLTPPASNLGVTTYAYDTASRLQAVGDGTNAVLYSYLTNSPRWDHLVFQRSAQNVITTTRENDALNRLTGVNSSGGGVPAASFHYLYNAADQRTTVLKGDQSAWKYQYDALGQITSGRNYWADATPVAGQQFTYDFDDIGNRKFTASGGDAVGANLRAASYTANPLNQYTRRDVPGYASILGTANPDATVTVNLQRVIRQGNYFRGELAVSNTGAPQWLALTNLAVLNNGTNADIVSTNIGALFVAQTPESFSYDADGNQTSDGRFAYAWDAEGRLVSATSLTNAPAASRVKLEFAYDCLGRRIQKIVSTNNGTVYKPQSTNRFAYDGWNLVAVLNQTNGVMTTFRWGTDLSGTLQGAGGVGGAVSMTIKAGTNAGTYFYVYDGVGNVVALVNAATAVVSALYEYDPFGGVLRATGPVAKINPFRFSTKYQDDETGLDYYGYRYYDPDTGRWLSRDPVGETGGPNLYGFVNNGPVTFVDPLGMNLYAIDGTGLDETFNSNIQKFYQRYKDGSANYYRGPGNVKDGNSVFGMGWGAGSAGIVKTVVEKICEDFNYNQGIRIDIVGFSRGAAIANEIATELYKNGCSCMKSGHGRNVKIKRIPKIRFLGIYDPVYSFPWYDQWAWNDKTISKNVQFSAIAYSRDENRIFFRPAILKAESPLTELHSEWFPGVHSDIGGSNDRNIQIGRLTLKWMIELAEKTGMQLNSTGLLSNQQIESYQSKGFFVPFLNSGITTFFEDSVLVK